MRLVVLCLAVSLLSGCFLFKRKKDRDDGDSIRRYYPHICSNLRRTPAGNEVCNHPKPSVVAGFVTEAEIDGCVDASAKAFKETFPEFASMPIAVGVNDDYALFIPPTTGWSADYHPPRADSVVAVLWTRGTGPAAPSGNRFIVRPPGEYWSVHYADWRWTDLPIFPGLLHAFLHQALRGDADHKDERWKRLPKADCR